MDRYIHFKPPTVVLEKAKEHTDWSQAVKELYPLMLAHLAVHVELDLDTEPQELVKKAREYDLMNLTREIFLQAQNYQDKESA